jgi:scyllo-inositol 2-dehydrogenase (NADP+)
MLRVGIIGIGKMGLSHLSIINSHSCVRVVGLCDATGYVLDVMNKYTGFDVFANHRVLIDRAKPDAVIIATPSRTHCEIARYALQRGIHVFVEKPLCLSIAESRDLVALAARVNAVNQVGYHYRFVGAFQETKQLLERGVVGEIHNFRVEAYGPVVLRRKGGTWRSNKSEGGGCLYDYASHAVNLVNYLFGMPSGVSGSVIHGVFSKGVDDEVYSTLYFPGGLSGQLCINWSDETHRKMSMRVEAWGKNGKINADRQECQVYLRSGSFPDLKLARGWNVRYATDLTQPVRYYVRGEEYSAQMDYFVDCIESGRLENVNSFAAALETDVVLEMLQRDAEAGQRTETGMAGGAEGRKNVLRQWLIRRLAGGQDLQRVP